MILLSQKRVFGHNFDHKKYDNNNESHSSIKNKFE
jgi:hypothetical protein